MHPGRRQKQTGGRPGPAKAGPRRRRAWSQATQQRVGQVTPVGARKPAAPPASIAAPGRALLFCWRGLFLLFAEGPLGTCPVRTRKPHGAAPAPAAREVWEGPASARGAGPVPGGLARPGGARGPSLGRGAAHGESSRRAGNVPVAIDARRPAPAPTPAALLSRRTTYAPAGEDQYSDHFLCRFSAFFCPPIRWISNLPRSRTNTHARARAHTHTHTQHIHTQAHTRIRARVRTHNNKKRAARWRGQVFLNTPGWKVSKAAARQASEAVRRTTADATPCLLARHAVRAGAAARAGRLELGWGRGQMTMARCGGKRPHLRGLSVNQSATSAGQSALCSTWVATW